MTQQAARATKSTLRLQIRQHLALVDETTARNAGATIARRLSQLLPHGPGALFSAWNGEVDLQSLHQLVSTPLAYPRCLPARQLRFHWSDSPPTHRDALGLPAPLADTPTASPADFAFILVPGAAFDRHGHRLGWGAGYYDRFLATLPCRTLRIGVAHDWQILDSVPAESHDIPMHFVLTPNNLLDCRRQHLASESEARMESP